eukprot:GILJ01003848.1.p1 GENE.GILJ01003848.1~~GILJ01003848.1.p1  ORF type:complete len:996 (-),score=129.78 GILJ01003848.1:642-3572(-)
MASGDMEGMKAHAFLDESSSPSNGLLGQLNGESSDALQQNGVMLSPFKMIDISSTITTPVARLTAVPDGSPRVAVALPEQIEVIVHSPTLPRVAEIPTDEEDNVSSSSSSSSFVTSEEPSVNVHPSSGSEGERSPAQKLLPTIDDQVESECSYKGDTETETERGETAADTNDVDTSKKKKKKDGYANFPPEPPPLERGHSRRYSLQDFTSKKRKQRMDHRGYSTIYRSRKWSGAEDELLSERTKQSTGTTVGPLTRSPSAKEGSPVVESLEDIQKQKSLKETLEQAIIQFNRNPKQGLALLWDKGLLPKTARAVAEFLLTTEGLDKAQIGDYLGERNDFNIAVLDMIVECLDFTNLEFDEALRYFISRFRLPGESQKIDRCVSRFAVRYHEDNPNVFNNSDEAYCLSYALIMLNTDAHSKKVKHKMAKRQFIRNNKDVFPTLSVELMERMYDRIVSNEIKVNYDYLERLYKRVGDPTAPYLQVQDVRNVINTALLKEGATFTKFGRRGHPHLRHVCLNNNGDMLCWSQTHKKSSSRDSKRSIALSEITDVLHGCNNTAVFRKNAVPPEFDSLCFSLVSKHRTLDLQAKDRETATLWIAYFEHVVQQNLMGVQTRDLHSQQMAREERIAKLSDIWKGELLPNWDQHWDYGGRRPKGFNLRQLAPKKSLFGYRDSSSASGSKNKSPFLVELWKQGIPPSIRTRLWPIAVGNPLQITRELYDCFLQQAHEARAVAAQTKDAHVSRGKEFHVARMKEDLANTFPELTFFHTEGPLMLSESILDVLETYILYRPDIGYVQGMSHLAAVLLLYMEAYEAFLCFANLVHGNHFLPFFRLDNRQIKWRLDFFDMLFREQLPLLHQHFEALDISPDMYLLNWLLALYARTLPLDIVSRVWDCYLLEGEMFALKTALGILKLYAPRLERETFEECVALLTSIPKDIDEILLFESIESSAFSFSRFETWLVEQRRAEEKTLLLETLL